MCSEKLQEDTAAGESAVSLDAKQKVRRLTKPLSAKDSANEEAVDTAEDRVSQLMEVPEEEMQDLESLAIAAEMMWSTEGSGEDQLLDTVDTV